MDKITPAKEPMLMDIARDLPSSGWKAQVRFAPIVLKKSFGVANEFFRTANAFRARRYEGPHRFAQKRPRTFLATLQSLATARMSKNQLSRDFRNSSIFDFCNTICQ
jgi:hypothetical protein